MVTSPDVRGGLSNHAIPLTMETPRSVSTSIARAALGNVCSWRPWRTAANAVRVASVEAAETIKNMRLAVMPKMRGCLGESPRTETPTLEITPSTVILTPRFFSD
jgi:hypothetical protein